MHRNRASARHHSLSATSQTTRSRRKMGWGRVAATAIASVLSAGALATPAVAAQSHGSTPAYSFQTVNNAQDPTFNQLLGINNFGDIAGYFGSGAAGHPNQGYLQLRSGDHRVFGAENYPGSVQTQVTGLNDHGVTVGFWSDQNNANQVNDNFGFYAVDGDQFHNVNFPASQSATPPVNQLLGVNDSDIAVGFYTDAGGASHGYTYNIGNGRFRQIDIPGAMDTTTAAINNRDQIAGFEVDGNGNTDAFLMTGRIVTVLDYPGATSTEALGLNDKDEVVGVYTDQANVTHGFTWTPGGGFQTVDDPNGVGGTTINGVNDRGQLVGFYTDANGNTDGLVAAP